MSCASDSITPTRLKPNERQKPQYLQATTDLSTEGFLVSHDPKFDGLEIFVADIALLRIGDVLLTRNRMTASMRNRRKSDIISKFSGGRFSHALLCTGSPTFIEAIDLGVSNLSLQNCFAHSLADVRLLRYHDESIAKDAGNWMLTSLGQSYSTIRAFKSILPSWVVPLQDKGTFCSALVATAYRAAGAHEFAESDPLKITPANLEHSPCFQDVTDTVFQKILAPYNAEKMSALDGDRNPSPVLGQATVHAEIYATIAPAIHDIILRYQLPKEKVPDTFMQALAFVLELKKTTKLHKMPLSYQNDVDLLDGLLLKAMHESKLNKILIDSIMEDDDGLKRTIAESFNPSPDLNVELLQSMLEVTKGQIERRSSIMDNVDYPRGQCRAWDMWLELTELSLRAFALRRQVLEEVIGRLRA